MTHERVFTQSPAKNIRQGWHFTSAGGNYRSTVTRVEAAADNWSCTRIYFRETGEEEMYFDFNPEALLHVSYVPDAAPTPPTAKSKELTVDEIREKLRSDWRWQQRGILALYAKQTQGEQNAGMTYKHNGVGFNSADGEILSSFARQLQRGKARLTNRQLAIASKKLPKYAKQLHRIAYGS